MGVSMHQGASDRVVSEIRRYQFKRIRSSAGGATVIGEFVSHLKRFLMLMQPFAATWNSVLSDLSLFFQEKLKMWASIRKCLVCLSVGEKACKSNKTQQQASFRQETTGFQSLPRHEGSLRQGQQACKPTSF